MLRDLTIWRYGFRQTERFNFIKRVMPRLGSVPTNKMGNGMDMREPPNAE
jgi:hypothetical protein